VIRLGTLLVCALGLLSATGAARAQNFPSRPVTVVAPFGAGSTADVIIRVLADRMRESLGQPIVVENRVGAAGSIGTAYVARAAPDGHTLLMASQSHTANPSLYHEITWDPVKSFAPVTLVGVIPNVIVVNKALPVRSLDEFVRYARARPGRLNYAGGGGVGGSPHLTVEMLKSLAGISLVHIPYRNAPDALNALLAGDVSMTALGLAVAKPRIEAGELRALAVTTPKRSPLLPNVPTVAESGFPDYDVRPWYAVLAPAGTPANVVAKLNAAIAAALKAPEVEAKLRNLGLEPEPSTPEELASFLQADTARWAGLIRRAGIHVE
jgi:tripartite-type tricarboxylate transporter receptor subunit TctC